MKKVLLNSILLLCALIVGSNAWASTKTEGFETKSASSTYNSTVSISTSESDCSIEWTIYYGCVSTNDKISGSNSAQMRWYSSATSNIPYAKTTTAIDGLSNVSLKARTSDLNVKMDVCYSANGSTWTVGKTHTFSKASTAEAVSLDIPSGNKYVKFEVSSSSTAPSSGNYKLIIDDVVFTYTSSLTPATWSVSPASATVDVGESTVLDLSTNYDGTLSFESNDDAVATVSYNSSTKKITVTGVAPGSTTISVTGAATSTYEAISKSITANVNHSEYESNTTDEMGPLGYSYFELTPSGTNTYAEVNSSAEKTDAYGVTITITRNGNSNSKPRFDTDYWRFYNGNTLTVEAPDNSYITKIVFVEPETGKSWTGSMTADKGDYVSFAKAWYATSTNVTSVTLTNDATKRIAKLQIYLNRSTLPVTITAAGWATFSSPYALDFTDKDINAYVIKSVSGSVVNLTPVNKVPANTGLLLSGDTDDIPVISSANADANVDNNLLVATDGSEVTAASNRYVLAKQGTPAVLGFYILNEDLAIPEGKAYLDLGLLGGGGAPAIIHIIDEENGATNINAIDATEEAIKFIQNGKLFIKKNGVIYDMIGSVVR